MSSIVLAPQCVEPFVEGGCELARCRHFRHSETLLMFVSVGLGGEAESRPGPVIT